MEIMFIDFEASSAGPLGFPIEVAWTFPGTGPVFSSLIRPEPGWEVPGSWDPAAQAVHGIPRGDLEGGRARATVARAAVAAWRGRRILSDMPWLDARMLRLLAGADAPEVGDFWEAARAAGGRAREAAAVNGVDAACPARHRAWSDVRRLRWMWDAMACSAAGETGPRGSRGGGDGT